VNQRNRRPKVANGNREKAHRSRQDRVVFVVKPEQAPIRFAKLSVTAVDSLGLCMGCGRKHTKEYRNEWTLRLLDTRREAGRGLAV
jgi:hypothetical protein